MALWASSNRWDLLTAAVVLACLTGIGCRGHATAPEAPSHPPVVTNDTALGALTRTESGGPDARPLGSFDRVVPNADQGPAALHLDVPRSSLSLKLPEMSINALCHERSRTKRAFNCGKCFTSASSNKTTRRRSRVQTLRLVGVGVP